MTCLGGPEVTLTTVTAGDGAVEQNEPEPEPENVAKVVFELTVPPFTVATMESSPAHDAGAVIVNVAVPVASVIAVPLWPESGPVIVKVTVVPTTGSPFDKTTAVLVMVEPEVPHTIEEFTGETTMVGTPEDPEAHPLMMVS